MNEKINEKDRKQFKQTVMLYINEKLYNEDKITEDMYHKAKDLILRKVA